jgi:hypothetical protein
MAESETIRTDQCSQKLNVVIGILLHFAAIDPNFNDGRRTTGDLAAFLKRHGLEYLDIAAILDSPVTSVRELVRQKKQKTSKKKPEGK